MRRLLIPMLDAFFGAVLVLAGCTASGMGGQPTQPSAATATWVLPPAIPPRALPSPNVLPTAEWTLPPLPSLSIPEFLYSTPPTLTVAGRTTVRGAGNETLGYLALQPETVGVTLLWYAKGSNGCGFQVVEGSLASTSLASDRAVGSEARGSVFVDALSLLGELTIETTCSTWAVTLDPLGATATTPSGSSYADATLAGATAVCADGTWSYSAQRSGACSWHGGVHWWTGNLGPAGPGGN